MKPEALKKQLIVALAKAGVPPEAIERAIGPEGFLAYLGRAGVEVESIVSAKHTTDLPATFQGDDGEPVLGSYDSVAVTITAPIHPPTSIWYNYFNYSIGGKQHQNPLSKEWHSGSL